MRPINGDRVSFVKISSRRRVKCSRPVLELVLVYLGSISTQYEDISESVRFYVCVCAKDPKQDANVAIANGSPAALLATFGSFCLRSKACKSASLDVWMSGSVLM